MEVESGESESEESEDEEDEDEDEEEGEEEAQALLPSAQKPDEVIKFNMTKSCNFCY